MICEVSRHCRTSLSVRLLVLPARQPACRGKAALIAVARKLLLLIYAIWKNDSVYIPNYKSCLNN